MKDAPAGATTVPTGRHERHLAVSAFAQQGSQIVATVALLVSLAVLARSLSLSAFGTYGLLVSLTAYLAFVQGTVEVASVKAIAESRSSVELERAVSTALALYIAAGLVVGALLAFGGILLLGLFQIPHALQDEARGAMFALAVVTALGWPMKVFQDVLRGSGRFVASAAADTIAYVALAVVLIGLALANAPLWALVGVGGSAPLLIGLASAGAFAFNRIAVPIRRQSIEIDVARSFGRISGYFLLMGVADFAIYSLDRVIIAIFRSAALVGLYEGPVRAHNLVRQMSNTFVVPVFPTAAGYVRDDDVARQRDLLVRGTRYTLAFVVPLALVLMILARPILIVWLGPKFAAGSTAMSILIGYWLVTGGAGVAAGMLAAAGQYRRLAAYALSMGALNLVLSLALVVPYGLTGVALGTTIPYIVLSPYVIWLALTRFSVSVGRFGREVWLPAYSTGVVVAVLLLGLRASFSLDSFFGVAAASAGSALLYWLMFYGLWLRPAERRLLRETIATFIRR